MQGMSWETDAKKAGELYPLIQKNDVEACGQLLEIIERHALGVIRKQLKEYQIYDGELEQEILTEGCVQVYRKMSEGFWVANEQFKPEDTLAYCMGIYRMLTVRYGTKKIEELSKTQSLEGMEEAGQPVKVSKQQEHDPFEAFLRKEEFETIGKIIHMYMSEFFDFRREPYMLLCLGYAKILSHIISDENKNNAVDWAFAQMSDRNIEELSREFLDTYNRSDKTHQYQWGERYKENLKKAYRCSDMDVIRVAEIIITEEFNRKDASQWCIRVNKAIIDALAKKALEDPTMTELLMNYADFRNAVNKAKNGKKGDRKK